MILAAVMLVAAQLLSEAYTYGDENLVAGDVREAGEVFRRVCLQPFPDGTVFAAAVAAAPGFTRVDGTEVATLGRDGRLGASVGGVWASRTINVRYIAAGAVAATFAQPQCLVTVRLAAAPDHTKLAADMGEQLGLGAAQSVQAGPFVRSSWTIDKGDDRGWRVQMRSQTHRQGNYMRLSLVIPAATK